MSLRVAWGMLAGFLVVAGAGAGEDAAKADMKKMQGKWQLQSEVKDGEKRPEDYVKTIQLSFDGKGAWTVKKEGDVLFEGSSKANPSRDPKQIDMTLAVPEENK